MRGNEAAEPLLLEEGRHGGPDAIAEPEAEGRRIQRDGGGGSDEGSWSHLAAGGGSTSASTPAWKDDTTCGSGAGLMGQSVGGRGGEEPAPPIEALHSALSLRAATTPGVDESDAENVQEAAAELVVSSSVHFEVKRQMQLPLVLLETAFDVLQLIETELQLGLGSVLFLKHGLLALVSLLMAVWDCIVEVKEEIQYQKDTKWQSFAWLCPVPSALCSCLGAPSGLPEAPTIVEGKVERKELSPGFLARWIVVPILVCFGLFPKEAAPFGTWWNRKLQHSARVIAVARVEVWLNLLILLGGCASALYSVAKAAQSGKFGTLEKVTAANAVQTIFFILYKSHRQRRSMRKLEEKLQKLRQDRSLGWEAREKLQQLQQNRQASLPEKAWCFQQLVVEYPEYFFADSRWSESEACYVDIYSATSDPARTGARGGVPALEDVSKLLALKLDGCEEEERSAEEAAAILLLQGEAGAGKSTLAKLVALRATKASLRIKPRHPESRVTGVSASVAPLVVYLHCAQHQREGISRVSLRSHLESLLLGDAAQASDKDWNDFLEEIAIVLVLDAYDEADSRFSLREVLQRDDLVNARSLRIVATMRSGTFETDRTAKETFSVEIKGQQVSPIMRWLRPIGDDERKSSALAPFAAVDDLWQKLHLKHPGLARVATTPLMAALVAKAHNEGALRDLGKENCGATDAGDNSGEATLGNPICQSRVRRRAHLISWHLKRQVEIGIDSLRPFADIDLVLHKLLFGAGSTSASAIPSDGSMLKDVWMRAGQVVTRKLASLMWLCDTTVLRVTPPKVAGKEGCCFASLRSMLPSTLSPCCSGASVDGSYSRVDTEVAGAIDTAEEKDVKDDVGQQLRDCLRHALPDGLRAWMDEVDMHVMLLYLVGFCCSLKILRTTDAGTCEVAFTHDTFRACRLAEAMASQNDWSRSADEASSSLWACRLLLAHEHKDLITLLADTTRTNMRFQDNFLWPCIEASKLQTDLGNHVGQSHSCQQASANGSCQGNEEKKPNVVAAANAATVLACAQVSFSGRDLSRAQLPGACLRGAVCHGTNFDGASLQGADLSHVFAEAASFRGARLRKAWYGEYGMFQGHSEAVKCVAFSPDGRNIASGSCDNTVGVWDVASGAQVMTLEGHAKDVRCVACSPDGSTIASGSDDTTVRLWDAATGSHRRTLAGHSAQVWSVAYSPDGRAIASGSFDKVIQLWDASSGVLMQTLHAHGAVCSVAYHPDGKTLASACGNTILLWDVTSGSRMLNWECHCYIVWCVAYSPDGRTIASCGDWHGTIRVWDAVAGSHLLTIECHSDYIICVAYSPDGATIACGGGGKGGTNTIRLVDATSGSHILTLAGHLGVVNGVAYSPDGRFLASADDDKVIRLWDAMSGPCMLQRDGHSDPVWRVAFSPDGSAVASLSFDTGKHSQRCWNEMV